MLIKIDPNKTMTELIKFFFERINRSDLFGDPNIRFISNAKFIIHDSKESIKSYFNDTSKCNTIIVDDLDDKIKNINVNE